MVAQINSGNTGMETLIPIVNKLHDIYTTLGPEIQFDLPQIAVVGGQSAGKSSVLENFVGRDFLPRGSGIVTRRPLILQLINSPQEWGEFLHKKGVKFYSFDDIRTEIEADTDRITGSNKGISNLPINLRIYSPHVLDITLIDLPGLTRNPIGDQPEDIEHQIRDMILEYISKETCLILAVTPANVDLGTSDALKLARLADPEGSRTIGVITKLDLMDAGTDASQILENKLLPLKRGYVGVVNRSQKDIDGKKDIKVALEAERKFFQGHAAYRRMCGTMGTPYLQKVLNEQLTTHIRDCLPFLRAKLRKEEAKLAKEVEEHHLDDPGFKTKIMYQMIHQLQSDFRRTIRGYGVVNTSELSGATKINFLFHDHFSRELGKLTLNETQIREQIAIAVRNSHGIEIGVFTPNSAFQSIVKSQIGRLNSPSINCVDLVTKEFCKIVFECLEKMGRFPRLREEAEFLVSTFVQERSKYCKEALSELLESEGSYINTKHEEFIGAGGIDEEPSSGGSPKNSRFRSDRPGHDHVIMKGYLSINSNNGFSTIKSSSKAYWFVLTSDTLVWYKDENETEKRAHLPIGGLHLREDSTGILNRRNAFTLYSIDGKPLTKEHKQLVMTSDTPEEAESWKRSFQKAGVSQESSFHLYQDSEHPSMVLVSPPGPAADFKSDLDPRLEKQVDTIRRLVDSYMRIVKRTIQDLVPKFIMNLIVKKTQDYLDEELLAQIQGRDPESLMAESSEEAAKRIAIKRTYDACKKSLQIINEISTATSSVSNSEFNSPKNYLRNSLHENNSPKPIPRGIIEQKENKIHAQIEETFQRPVPAIPRRPILKTEFPYSSNTAD